MGKSTEQADRNEPRASIAESFPRAEGGAVQVQAPMPRRGPVMPGDIATLSILAVVFATLTVRLAAVPDLWRDWLLHGALLLGFTAFVAVVTPRIQSVGIAYLRALVTVGIMAVLYVTLARVPFQAIPWRCDGLLERIDRAIFLGTSPALWMEKRITPESLDFFSLIYAIYIPYLYFSILLGCVGRPPAERDVFMTGLAITYAIGFLGYLFVPAKGPIEYLATEFSRPLEGGFFHQLVVDTLQGLGGPHGAFPSLHIGSSCFVCIFDLRYNRLRGLAYLPMVILIAVATVVVRYHYVIDLLAGALIAVLAFRGAHAWLHRWAARREGEQPSVSGDVS